MSEIMLGRKKFSVSRGRLHPVNHRVSVKDQNMKDSKLHRHTCLDSYQLQEVRYNQKQVV
jgi:hypothetical protein